MTLARKAGLKAVPTGIEHGTVTVIADGASFEVTTLRRDVETFGRHATVAFTEDWEEDARRRDFTLNALYAASDGTVFDPLGGYEDVVGGACASSAMPKRASRKIISASSASSASTLITARGLSMPTDSPPRSGFATDSSSFRRSGSKASSGASSSRRRRCDRDRGAVRLWAADRITRRGAASHALHGWSTSRGRTGSRLTRRCGSRRSPCSCRRMPRALPRASGCPTPSKRCCRLARPITTRSFPDENAAQRPLYRLGPCKFEALCCSPRPMRRCSRRSTGGGTRLPEHWQAPDFPLRGPDIMALGEVQGPEIGEMLRQLEAEWIDVGFYACPRGAARRVKQLCRTDQKKPISVAAKARARGSSAISINTSRPRMLPVAVPNDDAQELAEARVARRPARGRARCRTRSIGTA